MRWQHGPLRQRPPQPAANVRVGNAEQRVGTAAIRRRPQSVSKKLNMFNFCRRLLRWILHRVDTAVLPQTLCCVCTVFAPLSTAGSSAFISAISFLYIARTKVFSTTTAGPKTSWPDVFLSQHLLCFFYFLPPIRPAPE